jgi:methionine aminopeptidase type I
MGIVIKNALELAKMRRAGAIARAVLDAVEVACVPGTTTAALERIAAREMARLGATSAFLRYNPGNSPPYPAVLCTSINDVVVHGIPSPREVLREGDIIGIDFACYRDGYCADAARTLAVGVISAPARGLLDATREALAQAVAACGPGSRLGDIGAAVESLAARGGYGLVRDFVGHWRRPKDARGSAGPQLRQARHRPSAQARHDDRHRADVYPRRRRGAATRRSLVRGHGRRQSGLARRAHRRGDRARRRDPRPADRLARAVQRGLGVQQRGVNVARLQPEPDLREGDLRVDPLLRRPEVIGELQRGLGSGLRVREAMLGDQHAGERGLGGH